jgi:LysR family transcriptional regulator, low CO2-responsive transcriptional regulator
MLPPVVDLRISLHKLDVLSRVVQLGGVGKAAEDLYVAQPVVSAHLRSLENRLGGAELFYREGRQLHLTEAGRAVHAWAEDVLTRTRELERHLAGLSDGSTGSVVMGASMSVGSYVLPHVLTSFRARHPGAALRLGISSTEHAIEDTRTGALDFAVVVTEPNLELPGMEVEQIGSDEIVLVAAPDSEPHDDVISAQDFSRLPFIETPEGFIRRTFVERRLRDAGVVDRNVVLQLGHPEAMKRAAREGLGVTLLFRTAVRSELESGFLREVRVAGVDVVVPIALVHRKGKSFSALHKNLIAEIREAVSGASPAPAPAAELATAATATA